MRAQDFSGEFEPQFGALVVALRRDDQGRSAWIAGSSGGGLPGTTSSRRTSRSRSITACVAAGPSSSARSRNSNAASAEPRDIGDVRIVVFGGNRRQVDELNAHVLVVHHPRHRLAGRNGYTRNGRRACVSFDGSNDFPAFGGPRNTTWPAPCLVNLNVPGARFLGGGLRVFDLVGQFRNLRLEIGLDLLARLVLGQDDPQFLEPASLSSSDWAFL